MRFKVTTQLHDIFFSEMFATEWEALRQAMAWSKAKLGEVCITDRGITYSLDEFADRIVAG